MPKCLPSFSNSNIYFIPLYHLLWLIITICLSTYYFDSLVCQNVSSLKVRVILVLFIILSLAYTRHSVNTSWKKNRKEKWKRVNGKAKAGKRKERRRGGGGGGEGRRESALSRWRFAVICSCTWLITSLFAEYSSLCVVQWSCLFLFPKPRFSNRNTPFWEVLAVGEEWETSAILSTSSRFSPMRRSDLSAWWGDQTLASSVYQLLWCRVMIRSLCLLGLILHASLLVPWPQQDVRMAVSIHVTGW